jgi:hypothetical protein
MPLSLTQHHSSSFLSAVIHVAHSVCTLRVVERLPEPASSDSVHGNDNFSMRASRGGSFLSHNGRVHHHSQGRIGPT